MSIPQRLTKQLPQRPTQQLAKQLAQQSNGSLADLLAKTLRIYAATYLDLFVLWILVFGRFSENYHDGFDRKRHGDCLPKHFASHSTIIWEPTKLDWLQLNIPMVLIAKSNETWIQWMKINLDQLCWPTIPRDPRSGREKCLWSIVWISASRLWDITRLRPLGCYLPECHLKSQPLSHPVKSIANVDSNLGATLFVM